jgi:arabinose-5-phosphate isomerase
MLSDFFSAQKRYLDYFFDHIDQNCAIRIFQTLCESRGTLFFTGIGKSARIAEKIVQTMISTGTRAMYLEATSALHGDLGIVQDGDIVIFLTKSGESSELLDLMIAIKRKGSVKTMIWTSNSEAHILQFVDYSIILPLEAEICPFNLAPTTSSAVQLIFGDILAMAMMKKNTFSLSEYALNHPAGSIGQKIALRAKDLMLEGDELPLCYPNDKLCDVLVILSNKRCGCLLVVDDQKSLLGIFTDGDLRRAMQDKKENIFDSFMEDLMTVPCLHAYPDTPVRDILKIMQANPHRKVMMLPVIEDSILKGLVHMHDVVSPFHRQRTKKFIHSEVLQKQ